MALPVHIDGRQWSRRDGQKMLDHFKRVDVAEELAACKLRGYSGRVGVERKIGRDAVEITVDPLQQRLQPDTERRMKKTMGKWQEFLSQPRDVYAELAKIGETPDAEWCNAGVMAGVAASSGIEALQAIVQEQARQIAELVKLQSKAQEVAQ